MCTTIPRDAAARTLLERAVKIILAGDTDDIARLLDQAELNQSDAESDGMIGGSTDWLDEDEFDMWQWRFYSADTRPCNGPTAALCLYDGELDGSYWEDGDGSSVSLSDLDLPDHEVEMIRGIVKAHG